MHCTHFALIIVIRIPQRERELQGQVKDIFRTISCFQRSQSCPHCLPHNFHRDFAPHVNTLNAIMSCNSVILKTRSALQLLSTAHAMQSGLFSSHLLKLSLHHFSSRHFWNWKTFVQKCIIWESFRPFHSFNLNLETGTTLAKDNTVN